MPREVPQRPAEDPAIRAAEDTAGPRAEPARRESSPRPSAHLVWIGHSTVLLHLDGVRLLTDPLLRDRVSYLRRRVPPVDPAWYAGVDAVLVSHLHFDHLDLPSLRLVGRETRLIVPRRGGDPLRRRGFRRVSEVEAGEETRVGSLTVRAAHAEHPGARAPLGLPFGLPFGLPLGLPLGLPFGSPFGAKAPALGYVVAGSLRAYFAGDTGIFDGMAEIGRPPLHAALLPVGGWGPFAPLWERLPVPVPGHLDPRRAAEALRLLRPLVAVPIHWGTYAPLGLGRPMSASLGDPPAALRRHATELAPGVEVRALGPGGRLRLDTIGGGPS